MTTDLRIAVLGVGMMGADHVARITERTKGATVTVLNDYLPEKAEELAATIPGCTSARRAMLKLVTSGENPRSCISSTSTMSYLSSMLASFPSRSHM